MRWLKAFVGLIVASYQFAGCFDPVCEGMMERGAQFRPRILGPMPAAPIGGVVTGPDEASIIVSGPFPLDHLRWVHRRPRAGADELLATLSIDGEFGGGGVVLHGDRWWFATGGRVESEYGISFLDGAADGHVRSAFVAHPRLGPNLTLPLEGVAPRVLHLSFIGFDPYSLEAVEVLPQGISRTWSLDPPQQRTFSREHYSAEILPDQTVAVVSIERNAMRKTDVVLRILAEEARVTRSVLRTVDSAALVDTAVDRDGRLAVVMETGVGQSTIIEGAVFDPLDPKASWEVVSLPGAFSPSVVSTGHNFVVAWLRGPRPLVFEAREFSIAGAGLVTLEVGSAGGKDSVDSFATMHAQEEEVTFLWQDDVGRLAVRTYSANLAGFALAQRIIESVRRRIPLE